MSEAAAGAASSSPASSSTSQGSGSQSAPQSNTSPAQGPGVASKSGSQPQAASSKGQAQPSTPGASQEQKEVVQALKELAEDNMDAVVKIKVNGQVRQVSVREALKLAEKGEGADQKFQRAAQIESAAKQLARMAKEDPDSFMRQWGIDPDNYSQARLAKALEEQMMTPEQRELAQLKAEKARRDKAEQERQANEKLTKEQQEYHAADQQYRSEIMDAWQGSGLPPHPTYGIEIAKEMLRGRAQGIPLTAKQAAANVKRDWIANTGNILDSMDADAIYQSLPKTVHDKLRDYYVKLVSGSPAQGSAKAQSSTSRPGQSPASSQSKSSPGKMLSEKEYREWFSKR